jgi:hypothetical protein
MFNEGRENPMRINNVHLNGLVVGQVREPEEKDAIRPEAADSESLASSKHTPSAELTRLVSLAQEEPPVRSAAVAQATARLDAGDYLTHESALATAHALIRAQE